MTERALARRYISESREASRLEVPTAVGAIVDVLDGTLVSGGDSEVTGRVWVLAMDAASLPIELAPGDVAVLGDRPDAQRRALELGVALLVTSNLTVPSEELVALARERGTRSSPRPWTASSVPG